MRWQRLGADVGARTVVGARLVGGAHLWVDLFEPDAVVAWEAAGPAGQAALARLLDPVGAVTGPRPVPEVLDERWARLFVTLGLGSYTPEVTDPAVHDVDVGLAWLGLGLGPSASDWLDAGEEQASWATVAVLAASLRGDLPEAVADDVTVLAGALGGRSGPEGDLARRVLAAGAVHALLADRVPPFGPSIGEGPRAAFVTWRTAVVAEAIGDDRAAAALRQAALDKLAEADAPGPLRDVIRRPLTPHAWRCTIGELVVAVGLHLGDGDPTA